MSKNLFYIGLMSGTSLDGVDGVLTSFDGQLTAAYSAFPADLKQSLLLLQSSGPDEIHRESIAAQQLAHLYAQCVHELLASANINSDQISAIGAHGQTIRHQPSQGYTRQLNQPALLAELTGIDVIADFRSRDIAAGGQGAPLVPAFHQAVFGLAGHTRVVVNIGGISNISILSADGSVSGFDTGPGNVLMDAWIHRHQAKAYDVNGVWAATGSVNDALLAQLMSEPFFAMPAPKSTGRDLFNLAWLQSHLNAYAALRPEDVQATLIALTTKTIADAIRRHAATCDAVYVCGGGAYNSQLMQSLQRQLSLPVSSTDVLGISPSHVEALAFAWLAKQFCERLPGNLPSVTGAKGDRILGALYPA
jgi:anhydro-N-acetylmuramic acid kinase